MTKLEEAFAELSRHVSASTCVLYHDSDYVTADIEEHMKTCPLVKQYKETIRAVSKLQQEWNKVSKQAKDKLFSEELEK